MVTMNLTTPRKTLKLRWGRSAFQNTRKAWGRARVGHNLSDLLSRTRFSGQNRNFFGLNQNFSEPEVLDQSWITDPALRGSVPASRPNELTSSTLASDKMNFQSLGDHHRRLEWGQLHRGRSQHPDRRTFHHRHPRDRRYPRQFQPTRQWSLIHRHITFRLTFRATT